MKIDGGCHCGAITFEAEIDPSTCRICHCTDCQQMSGSAYRVNVPAPAADFRFLTGAPKIYVKTTAASGRPRQQAFCENCGTQIYACEFPTATVYNLRVGTITQRAALAPGLQGWRISALPWVDHLAAIPSIPRDFRPD
jgi:hypothetical protein